MVHEPLVTGVKDALVQPLQLADDDAGGELLTGAALPVPAEEGGAATIGEE